MGKSDSTLWIIAEVLVYRAPAPPCCDKMYHCVINMHPVSWFHSVGGYIVVGTCAVNIGVYRHPRQVTTPSIRRKELGQSPQEPEKAVGLDKRKSIAEKRWTNAGKSNGVILRGCGAHHILKLTQITNRVMRRCVLRRVEHPFWG
jgi:hypothetical protein